MVLKEVPNFVKKLEETTVINDVQVGSPHFHFIDSSQIKGKSLYSWLLDEINSTLETVLHIFAISKYYQVLLSIINHPRNLYYKSKRFSKKACS